MDQLSNMGLLQFFPFLPEVALTFHLFA
jgi:hypothetical protein